MAVQATHETNVSVTCILHEAVYMQLLGEAYQMPALLPLDGR